MAAGRASWGALALCAGLLVGCPQKTQEPVPPAPPSGGAVPAANAPVAPPPVLAPQPAAAPDKVVPPQPKPKNQAEAWEAAALKQTHWRVSLAKAFKEDKERAALLEPFAKPSAELLRLVSFARAFPCYDLGVTRAVRFDHQLKRLYETDAFLGSTPLKPQDPAAFALLVLADAKVLLQSRFLLTPKGWQSPRQGLSDGSYPGVRARPLLEGVVLARDGRWSEAVPLLTKALRAEAAALSAAAKDAKVQQAWDTLSPLFDQPDVDSALFGNALQAWSNASIRKDLEGPASLNKKQ